MSRCGTVSTWSRRLIASFLLRFPHALDRIEYCGDIDRQSFQQYGGRQRAAPEDTMFDVGPAFQP
jgi:hypothetical protein